MTSSTLESPIVKLVKVNKSYRQGKVTINAVKDVSLEIHKGDFAALCGPSGSGKTSILNLIGALDKPDSGQVIVNGADLSTQNQSLNAEVRKNQIGFVFQSYNLIPVMTAFENAAFVLDLQNLPKDEIESRVMEVLADVGLKGLEHRKPDEMSGGQQQRVAIARAIVTKPAIVLADEPTANVDSETALSLLKLMKELNEKHHITFLFSTHDQHVMDCARRIISVHDGEIAGDTLK